MMQRNQVEEFYRELDATQEDFVRKKFAVGGYAGWKIKHVRTWLDAREAAANARHAMIVRFWTIIGSIGTVIAAAATVYAAMPH